MATNLGNYTLNLDTSPSLLSFAAVGSKKEAEGPIGKQFDIINEDSLFGQKTWELAEGQMQKIAAEKALEKAALSPGEIKMLFAGDLLNQITASHYGLRELGIPFIGLYGACSTMSQSVILASMMVEGGLINRGMAVTSSHFCSAERQYRFPLEYGGQRPPTAQWTATAAGAVIVGQSSAPPYIRRVCVGTIENKNVKDLTNMGAAMAPAAAQTLSRFFADTGTGPDNYDVILTGDLGQVGSDLLSQLMEREGYKLEGKHADCGLILFDRDTQKVDAGGSGCGCAAAVLCAYLLPAMRKGKVNEVLFMATGALMSPTSVQQGQDIPGIAHLMHLSTSPKAGGG
ncbi:MAG: stage V sporulation protein AD [Oscillospiraceae bacterium]|nr:stage V sporulation protein AD [Oscillospiraceae bacterium]